MALIVKDRVKETTTTTGTGTLTLAGASTGFSSFADIGDGNTTYYAISSTGSEWEVGIGTYTASGTTLSRDTVLASSNSGSLVNLSAGSKDVFCTYPSQLTQTTNSYTGAATLTARENALADTSGGVFTLTLPASPNEGDFVIVSDAAAAFNTNNLTIGRNGNTIQGSATDLVCDIDQVSITLRYTSGDWRVYATVGATDGSVVTVTATQTLTNKTLTNPTINNYTEGTVAIGTVTTSHTFSLTNGTLHTATLTASTGCTFTMPTATSGKSFILILRQPAVTGNGTATFTGVYWAGGTAPTITAAAGSIDMLSFVSDGTNWYGNANQDLQ
jgi:hypothetical protein